MRLGAVIAYVQRKKEERKRRNFDFFCDKAVAHGMKAGGHVAVRNGACNIKVCENTGCEYHGEKEG